MSDMSADNSFTSGFEQEAGFGDYYALLKPRVMSLVVFTAFVGLMVAPVPVHPFLAFVSILFIALGGGASGALNMWYDHDIDAKMKRTMKRPIPAGKVTKEEAFGLGCALSGFSCIMLALTANIFAGLFLAFTIFFYVVIYTMWLKRLTPQNIVIGGAAGAFPPMIGWAVATGGVSIESVLMFMITFMWTPPHFWSLALFTKTDYADADVPMLTVTHGRVATRKHILAYTIPLAIVTLGIAATSIGGWAYLITSVVLNALFIRGAVQILKRDDAAAEADDYKAERSYFKLSLLYLFLHFSALLLEAGLKSFGWGGF
ncbi:heme o synthase [Halocynthiibacter sp.]|uniref:heme o synthase n=1 Tax=Halocynthiibacter sp. TaxID=1979210 RepID=UPI003C456799